MKTVIQLLIAALVLHASVRGGMAAWKYYEFTDAVRQEARSDPRHTPDELRRRILAVAAEHGIEMDPGDIDIQKDGPVTVVSAAYYEYIELVPRFYTREHLVEFEISVSPARPLTAEDLR